MSTLRKLSVILLFSLFISVTQAADLDGVTLPDTMQLDGSELVLNGMGTRKATMFKVKVYVMGLYLTEKKGSAKAILQSDQPKKILIHIVRDAAVEKIRNGWQKGFEKNAANLAALQSRIDEFNGAMTDMKTGDKMTLNFIAERVDVLINDKLQTSIEGADFQQGVLSIWLGPNPPNKDLKQGILGK